MKNKILIIGRSGSGKNYITEKIRKTLIEKNISCKQFAFADPLKENIKNLLNLNADQFEKYHSDKNFKDNTILNLYTLKIIVESDNEHKSELWNSGKLFTAKDLLIHNIDPETYMTLREFTVYYGTYVMQEMLGKRVWINTIFNILDDKDVNIITDGRFPEEILSCKEQGFKLVKIFSVPEVDLMSNVAESFTDSFVCDFEFKNYKNDEKKLEKEFKRFFKWLNS